MVKVLNLSSLEAEKSFDAPVIAVAATLIAGCQMVNEIAILGLLA